MTEEQMKTLSLLGTEVTAKVRFDFGRSRRVTGKLVHKANGRGYEGYAHIQYKIPATKYKKAYLATTEIVPSTIKQGKE